VATRKKYLYFVKLKLAEGAIGQLATTTATSGPRNYHSFGGCSNLNLFIF